jgi:hypothetical protein
MNNYETKKRPTHGMTREERLVFERKNLIAALPNLLQRRRGELSEGGRSSDRTVKLKIGRIVLRIRSISSEIGPVRPPRSKE